VADPTILSTIERLETRSAAILPPVRTAGEWNEVARQFRLDKAGPRGRDFSVKAVWMEDRKRAFFCGANHGAPHRLNDAWEYDLPSNTWVLLFPPDPSNAAGVIEITEFEVPEGRGRVKYVQTLRGGPTHYGHTWWGLAYDPSLRAALWMNVAIGESPAAYVKRILGSDHDIYKGPPLWAFDPYERTWRLIVTQGPYPPPIYAGAMEYIRDLGGCFWYAAEWNGQGMWVFQARSGRWKNLKPNGGENLYFSKSAPRRESVFCYDRANRIIVAQDPWRCTYHYSIRENKWAKVLSPDRDSSAAPSGHDAHSVLGYDPYSGDCLLFEFREADAVWSYNATRKTWAKQKVSGPSCPGCSEGRPIGYFDEARDVLVINNADRTWVYRHRRL
jgi:hypothetical protein